ncbi:MAG: helix-turn-helix transcriptional regulator [Patescibacteria group bacterium]
MAKHRIDIELAGLAREFQQLFLMSGWNQRECAQHLGVSFTHINGILNGGGQPSVTLVKLIKLMVEGPTKTDYRSLILVLEKFPVATRAEIIGSLETLLRSSLARKF